jgi:hypothetical protein
VTFFYQFGVPENPSGWRHERRFLDSRLHAGCRKLATIVAEAWRDAREQL